MHTKENGKTCTGDSSVEKGGANIQACQSTSVGGTETRLSFSGALSNMGSGSGGGGDDEKDEGSQRKLPEDGEVREAVSVFNIFFVSLLFFCMAAQSFFSSFFFFFCMTAHQMPIFS